jgi:WD40 repeat protein
MLYRVRYHKEAILALSFSHDEMYLMSLSCKSDGNQLVCWNMLEGRSECAQSATNQEHQEATDVCFYNTRRDRFVTAHDGAIKFWSFDETSHKFSWFDCKLAHNKRFFTCLAIDENDTFLYAGSRHGDIIIMTISTASYRKIGPVDKLYAGGINSINAFFNDCLIVGAQNGMISKINKKTLLVTEETQLGGGSIVSMANSKEKCYVLTAKGSLHSYEVT